MLNGLDLFSGIGGLAKALGPWVMPVAYCEIDPYAQGVLISRMECGDLPKAPIWDDVSTLRALALPKMVDIIYGGFPCQDISETGRGEGLGGKRSGLFFEIMRLADEIKPQFIFLENVRNIRSKGLNIVISEISKRGYDCRWDILPAYEDKAFFEGERWFLLAAAKGIGSNEIKRREGRTKPSFTFDECDLQKTVWREDAVHLARMDDGLSARMGRLKCLGNAVVPHQAQEAFIRLLHSPAGTNEGK